MFPTVLHQPACKSLTDSQAHEFLYEGLFVCAVRALKMHGGGPVVTAGKPLDHAYTTEDAALVKAGCCNLARHVTNTRKYGVPVVVAINKFATDTEAELETVREAALEAGTTPCMSCVCLTLVASFCIPSCVSASTMVIPCAVCCLVATFGVS